MPPTTDPDSPLPGNGRDTTGAPATSLRVSTAADVHRILSDLGSRSPKATAVILLALGGIFMDAYDFSSIAFGMPAITEQFGLTGFMTGLVNASIMIGAVVGALSGGYLVDRFGRYRLFMADMVFFVVAALGSALAPEAWSLIGFRFVMGIGVGLDIPVAMAFLAEFSRLRGKGNRSERVNSWSPAWYFATGTGYVIVLICFLLLPMDQQDHLWRIVVGFGAVPAVIVLLVRRRYMAESPQWLADQGDLRGAVDVLRSHYSIDAELVPSPEDQESRSSARTRLSTVLELFAPRYRLRTISALCVSVFSTFGYNAVAYGTPLIITTLFHQGPLVTIVSSLVINLGFGLAGGLLGMGVVSRFGSRKVTLVGFTIQAAALFTLAAIGVPSSALVLVAVAMLAAFIFAQAGGPGANLMNFATLSYPTRLRGIGVGFNQGTLRAFSVLSLLGFPILASSLGTGVFWIVACAPLLGAISLLLNPWDPTGKDVDGEDLGGTTTSGTTHVEAAPAR
ncbi:MFS transporter [Brachybacterium endophyticum]|uniref:MFS transporter n=1 Tax=Brachybacterium endophyticum TaxID=2182385 RepID=A0A2U2RPT0_9MICO|nr:MFS transporter [Brachybacterium endophyticum]PWH07877.1 MFS transporter [Brachybacterium endophyticum]